MIPFVLELDQALNKFYDGRFVSNAVYSKMSRLEAGFKSAIGNHFPDETIPLLVQKCQMNPKANLKITTAAIKVVNFDMSTISDENKFRELELLLCENNGRSLNVVSDEIIFQTTLIIKSVHLKDGIPQIKEHGLVNEQFTGAQTLPILELFTNGLAKRIFTEISPNLWPFFMKNLVSEEDQDLVYPTLLKMIRKNHRSTSQGYRSNLYNIVTKMYNIVIESNPRSVSLLPVELKFLRLVQ